MKTNKQKNTTQKNAMNFNCFLLQAAFQLSRIKMTQNTMKKEMHKKSRLNFNSFRKLFYGDFFKAQDAPGKAANLLAQIAK